MATEMKSQDSQTPSLYLWSATELQKQARFRMLHGAEWGFLQKKKKIQLHLFPVQMKSAFRLKLHLI